ncbi:MAG: hypothetical protein Q9213_001101 [Squamulea squamosa]
MDICHFAPDSLIGTTNITWTEAQSNILTNFTSSSYLRPDTGGALLPWLYTVIIIVIHLPVVVVRVVRWEITQSWCLVSAFFTVVVYIQAYLSTQFQASKILVWTPIVLVIDAGATLQVFFLVIEAKKVLVGDRVVIVDPPENEPNTPGTREGSGLLRRFRAIREPREVADRVSPETLDMLPIANGNQAQEDACRSCPKHCDQPEEEQLQPWKDPAYYSAVAALILFVAIVVLQLIGLVKAVQALHASPEPPKVRWCSPLFQPFGLAAVDGDCHVYDIDQNKHKGIGCIQIPGYWQQQWLKGTVAGVALELIFEVVDLLILSGTNRHRKTCGGAVKMKRPWTTIFSGAIVLLVTLIYGINYSSSLPPGVTGRMTVVENSQGPAAYTISLVSSGLRGTIIGWSDGLFENFRTTYFGNPSS